MTSITLSVTGAEAQASVNGPLTSGMVGIPVTIRCNDAWNGLTKNLVCRCAQQWLDRGESRTVMGVDNTATVAHEVMKAGMYLFLGVEGYRADGTLVIPTTWAYCGKIEHGAVSGADPSADPTLPVWGQLQAQIGEIRDNAVTDEQIIAAVAAYLEENPVGGSGSSQNGGSLAADQISALDNMFRVCAFIKADVSAEYAAFRTAFGISDSGEVHTHKYTSTVTKAATCTTAGVRTYTCSCGNSYTESIPATGHNYVDGVCTVCGATDPTYNPNVTLTGISAVYSGGDVAVGTAVSDLTGIVVTASYSDGSTEAVTGYTLSGTIAEGENTITVSYGGKTTTFSVTGVAESGGSDAVNLYSGELLKNSNISGITQNGNVISYTVDANGGTATFTIEGLEADKDYTIFVDSDRTDGANCYTQATVNTGNAAPYSGKLITVYPSWSGAGKNYGTFTANGDTMYLWFNELGGSVVGTTPTLTVYIYEGTLTERP